MTVAKRERRRFQPRPRKPLNVSRGQMMPSLSCFLLKDWFAIGGVGSSYLIKVITVLLQDRLVLVLLCPIASL